MEILLVLSLGYSQAALDFISERGGGVQTYTYTNIPKIGHVECFWSPPQGAPCSVHLTVRQLLMRASE